MEEKEKLLLNLFELFLEHRQENFLCHPDCFCWRAEKIVMEYQKIVLEEFKLRGLELKNVT